MSAPDVYSRRCLELGPETARLACGLVFTETWRHLATWERWAPMSGERWRVHAFCLGERTVCYAQSLLEPGAAEYEEPFRCNAWGDAFPTSTLVE